MDSVIGRIMINGIRNIGSHSTRTVLCAVNFTIRRGQLGLQYVFFINNCGFLSLLILIYLFIKLNFPSSNNTKNRDPKLSADVLEFYD